MRAEVPRPTGALPGAPPPWSALPQEERRLITLADVRKAWAARASSPARSPACATPLELPTAGDARPAGVLCLLFDQAGAATVVLTKRSAHLRSHSGEVSFPGGRLRRGELPLEAALREAREEIGLDPSAVEIVGELSPLTTGRSPGLVHGFVGIFPGPGPDGESLRANASEVERVFWVPLPRLAEDGVFHEELWPVRSTGQDGPRSYRAVPFFVLEEDIVWGATGRLLAELLSQVLGERGTGGLIEGTLVQE